MNASRFIKWVALTVVFTGLMVYGETNMTVQGHSRIGTYEAQCSQSHSFISLSGIALGDVSPTFRMRLRILVVDLGAVKIREIRPWLRGNWAVVWAPNDTLVVCGRSDDDPVYLISAYECHIARPIIHRFPTDAEVKLVIEAFHKKYGINPSPIRRTLRGDLP